MIIFNTLSFHGYHGVCLTTLSGNAAATGQKAKLEVNVNQLMLNPLELDVPSRVLSIYGLTL